MKKYVLLTALAAIAALSGVSGAQANDQKLPGNFTSHHLVDKKSYADKAEKLPAAEKLELREYLNYEQREPCQFYQEIPQGFVREGCRLRAIAPAAPVPAPAPVVEAPVARPVLVDYQIFFDLDSAVITPYAVEVLNKIAREITTYNPGDVTVGGFTDTSGNFDYNLKLSERRADAVSKALTERGVAHRVINTKAFGQTNLAVQTPDNTVLRENRRAVVEFLK